MNKEAILDFLGLMPENCPPEVEVIEELGCEGYQRLKISFWVEPSDRCYAYLLLPHHEGERLPAVYCHHQHTIQRIGKEEVVGLQGDSDLAYARELAERGFITFAPDAFTFGERKDEDDPVGYAYWELATRLVQGKTLLSKLLHDVSVGLDILQSRPEVDSDRMGFIGHSYGGRMAIWATAMDDRIKAAVCNCGCISYSESYTRDTGVQMEFVAQGIAQKFDMLNLIPMIAPRSLLILATEKDKWCRGVKDVFSATRSHFSEGKLRLAMYPGDHQFTDEMRNRAYLFLDEELNYRIGSG
jgi:dienelactone hydrolase